MVVDGEKVKRRAVGLEGVDLGRIGGEWCVFSTFYFLA